MSVQKKVCLCDSPTGEEKLYVVFCLPSAETIHQGFGAHYTLKGRQKENGNSVSKQSVQFHIRLLSMR